MELYYTNVKMMNLKHQIKDVSKRDEKRWKRSVRQHLKVYAEERFKMINDVIINLLFNIVNNHGPKWYKLFTS